MTGTLDKPVDKVEALVARYRDWLSEQVAWRDLDGFLEVTTAFLDRHNDHLQMYVRREGDTLLATDYGYTVNDLEMSGMSLSDPRQRELLNLILSGYRVRYEEEANDALTVSSGSEEFPMRLHQLLSAMLAVDSLGYAGHLDVEQGLGEKSRLISAKEFRDDVRGWLSERAIPHKSQVEYTGKGGVRHRFNFLIHGNGSGHMKLVAAINTPTRDQANRSAFAWIDTADSRSDDAKGYALLNDANVAGTIDTVVWDTLERYNLHPLRRSDARAMEEAFAH